MPQYLVSSIMRPLLSLSCGLMSPTFFYSSHWIFPEMSQKSAQAVLASSQCCWTLHGVKHGPTQPPVLGFLSLFLSFSLGTVGATNIAEKEDLRSLWLWLAWPSPDCFCAIPSRSFSYQRSTADWTGMPGCVLLTDQQNNWNLLEVQLSLSSSFLSCVPDWPSLPFYWAWQQLSSKRHWWECVVAHTISLPAPMDNLNSCDPTLKCQH